MTYYNYRRHFKRVLAEHSLVRHFRVSPLWLKQLLIEHKAWQLSVGVTTINGHSRRHDYLITHHGVYHCLAHLRVILALDPHAIVRHLPAE